MCAGVVCLSVMVVSANGAGSGPGHELNGKQLFERATFGGNGRTCETCHSASTGTVSPADARRRFRKNPADPLFVHDGSDDGMGHGVSRILATDATVLMTIPLAPNVTLADDPGARTVVLRRGIPTTLNTPALDPVLMLDGRQPSLEEQAAGAIRDHAQGVVPSAADLARSRSSSRRTPSSAHRRCGGSRAAAAAPGLPRGQTASEQRGRRFFEDVPPDPAQGLKPGLCAHCHSGPLLNRPTSSRRLHPFARADSGRPAFPQRRRVRIQQRRSNPTSEFVFNAGAPAEVRLTSPDPGRALDHRHRRRSDVRARQRVQDFAAARHPTYGAVLPRQLREDARRRRGALRDVLQRSPAAG